MTNRTKYTISSDDDGHYYYFPADKMAEFEEWCAAQYDEEENPLQGTCPDWLKSVGGALSLLTFENPECQ